MPVRFWNRPANLSFPRPRTIRGGGSIAIGEDVSLGRRCILKANRREGDKAPLIQIGDRVEADDQLHIAAYRLVKIGDDVRLGRNVFMADALHAYRRGDVPYRVQGMMAAAPIVIEQGCCIGPNVVLLPGATVGELAIVGPNSVVSHDVPPRSIVAGAPARVVERWDGDEKRWRRVEAEAAPDRPVRRVP